MKIRSGVVLYIYIYIRSINNNNTLTWGNGKCSQEPDLIIIKRVPPLCIPVSRPIKMFTDFANNIALLYFLRLLSVLRWDLRCTRFLRRYTPSQRTVDAFLFGLLDYGKIDAARNIPSFPAGVCTEHHFIYFPEMQCIARAEIYTSFK